MKKIIILVSLLFTLLLPFSASAATKDSLITGKDYITFKRTDGSYRIIIFDKQPVPTGFTAYVESGLLVWDSSFNVKSTYYSSTDGITYDDTGVYMNTTTGGFTFNNSLVGGTVDIYQSDKTTLIYNAPDPIPTTPTDPEPSEPVEANYDQLIIQTNLLINRIEVMLLLIIFFLGLYIFQLMRSRA